MYSGRSAPSLLSTSRAFSLPSPPASLAQVIRIAGDPEKSLRDLGAVCAHDPGLTLELLRIGNSARFAGGEAVRSVPAAVMRLGARAVRAHAITYSMRAAVAGVTAGSFNTTRFWEDNVRRAAAAQILAEKVRYPDTFEAFALGLIQDLGTLLLAVRFPSAAPVLDNLRNKAGRTRAEAERVLCSATHYDELAASPLAGILPEEVAQAMARHHQPPARIETRQDLLTWIGYAADLIADVVQAEPKDQCMAQAATALSKLKINLPLSAILDEVAKRMMEIAAELDISVRTQPDLDEILAEAEQAMQQLSDQEEARESQLRRALDQQQAEARRLEEHNRRLMQMASKDALTDLDNRRTFHRSLAAEVQSAAEKGTPLSVLMLDIDFFKKVNDTYGHPAGDQVLVAVARRIQGVTRTMDRVARLGGEEFGVLLPRTGRSGAQIVADRMRMAVEKAAVIVGSHAIPCTISVGGTTTIATRPADGEDLLEQADRALYRAKRTGRNRVCWHNPDEEPL